MSQLIDLEDQASLEKLGNALLKIPSYVVSMTKCMMAIPESRKIILDHVKPVLKEELDESFDARLAVSELKPIKRIAELELVTGIEDYYDDEEHESTIPERIEDLIDKLEKIEYMPTEKPTVEFKPDTKTGIRAMHIISKLKASGKNHLTHKEIQSALAGKDLPEYCRIDEKAKNPRKTIIDVLNEAVSLCSDVFLDQKKAGHREWRIALKS
jgi:hypothetical protein